MNKLILFLGLMAVILYSCGEQVTPVRELKHYPVDDLENLLTSEAVEIDTAVSYDGNGALQITTRDTTVINLYRTGDIDIEKARLSYQAHLRTRNLDGNAYLEMWCIFPEKGRYFSRGLRDPLTGDTDWTQKEIFFHLQENENPDSVEFNLVINGAGTVWIDDIHIMRKPLGKL